MTKARKVIIEMFDSLGEPIDAPDLLNRLRVRSIAADKSTVYRELDFLVTNRLIQEVDLREGRKRYESSFLDHHHHAVCTSCGSIEDVVLADDMKDQEEIIEGQVGFKIMSHALEFFGLCSNCK